MFDLDGTLCDLSHRLHFIQGPKKNYDAFYDACGGDKINYPIAALAHALFDAKYTLWLFSGRTSRVLPMTIKWLEESGMGPEMWAYMRFRREGDHTPDHLLKKTWWEEIPLPYRQNFLFAVEDRARMAAMWRSLGLPCLQVAEGDF